MNSYEISYADIDLVTRKRTRHSLGTVQASSGISGIHEALRAHGVPADDIAQGQTLGSNKRMILAGITFEARKVTA